MELVIVIKVYQRNQNIWWEYNHWKASKCRMRAEAVGNLIKETAKRPSDKCWSWSAGRFLWFDSKEKSGELEGNGETSMGPGLPQGIKGELCPRGTTERRQVQEVTLTVTPYHSLYWMPLGLFIKIEVMLKRYKNVYKERFETSVSQSVIQSFGTVCPKL